MEAFNEARDADMAVASDAFLQMMIFHQPSPAKAQKYRVEILFEGLRDDFEENAIRNYDSE